MREPSAQVPKCGTLFPDLTSQLAELVPRRFCTKERQAIRPLPAPYNDGCDVV
jgi:hypothetical protein